MSIRWWATMWVPRPMTQRSPIRSSVAGPSSWPGTVPAEIVTCWPTTVSAPISIHRSPKIAPGGKTSTDPGPNAANRRPDGLSAVTAPASRTARQARCTASCRARRAARWARPRHVLPGKPALPSAGGGGQLAAGAVDLPAAGVPHGDRHAVGLEPGHELVLILGPGRGPPGPPGRVERDQVDVGQVAGQQVAEQVRPPGLVVDVADQRVLDGNPAAGCLCGTPG